MTVFAHIALSNLFYVTRFAEKLAKIGNHLSEIVPSTFANFRRLILLDEISILGTVDAGVKRQKYESYLFI